MIWAEVFPHGAVCLSKDNYTVTHQYETKRGAGERYLVIKDNFLVQIGATARDAEQMQRLAEWYYKLSTQSERLLVVQLAIFGEYKWWVAKLHTSMEEQLKIGTSREVSFEVTIANQKKLSECEFILYGDWPLNGSYADNSPSHNNLIPSGGHIPWRNDPDWGGDVRKKMSVKMDWGTQLSTILTTLDANNSFVEFRIKENLILRSQRHMIPIALTDLVTKHILLLGITLWDDENVITLDTPHGNSSFHLDMDFTIWRTIRIEMSSTLHLLIDGEEYPILNNEPLPQWTGPVHVAINGQHDDYTIQRSCYLSSLKIGKIHDCHGNRRIPEIECPITYITSKGNKITLSDKQTFVGIDCKK